ncbi:hypothetical protein J6590_045390 [Homalodisca vitripennis]|nr:hypothetical protein J6590_045390 [Homalodisca vitripennis]
MARKKRRVGCKLSNVRGARERRAVLVQGDGRGQRAGWLSGSGSGGVEAEAVRRGARVVERRGEESQTARQAVWQPERSRSAATPRDQRIVIPPSPALPDTRPFTPLSPTCFLPLPEAATPRRQYRADSYSDLLSLGACGRLGAWRANDR